MSEYPASPPPGQGDQGGYGQGGYGQGGQGGYGQSGQGAPGGYPQGAPGGYPQGGPGGYPQQGGPVNYPQGAPGAYPQGGASYGPGPAANAGSFANWGQRAGSYIVDILPVIVLNIIGGVIGSTAITLLFDVVILAYTIYNRWYLGGTTGQSFGKRALSLRLVGEQTGQPIGPLMAFVRDICHILDTIACFVGWLFPLWDAKRQTFADKIVSTVVVPA